jgi:hypothetical protein
VEEDIRTVRDSGDPLIRALEGPRRQHVPLTAYINGNERVIGDAFVEGNKITAKIFPDGPGREILQFFRFGVVGRMSLQPRPDWPSRT